MIAAALAGHLAGGAVGVACAAETLGGPAAPGGGGAWVLAAAVLAAAAGAFFAMRARSLSRQIASLSAVAERIEAGESAIATPGVDSKTAAGALARSLDRIAQGGIEQRRIRAALDASNGAIMIADADLTIVYLNPVLQRMLKKSNGYWSQRVPGFDFTHIIGQSIDIFHEKPARQRAMLEQLETDFDTTISFDDRHFALTASPMRNASGERLGYVVQWADRTAALSVERQIADVISGVAAGRLDQRLAIETDDAFMTEMASGVNRICGIVDDFTTDLSRTMSGLASGDLAQRIEATYQGRFGALADSANATVDKLAELVGEIQTTAASMLGSTSEIAAGAADLSNRAESQASSLEETAATMEEMTATIRTNADNAGLASELSGDASSRARRGGEVVTETVSAMSRIEESSTKISDIISVIDAIAFQTNLLALNAAVEAARAGDAGKGFAVVASEVRTLAQRSADAAKDISALISESSQHVADGVQLVHRTGDSLGEIVEAVSKVAATVGDITAATREQAIGVQEVSNAISHMDDMTQRNSALAEQSAGAAKGLNVQAERLTELVNFFHTEETSAAKRGDGVPSPAVETAQAHAPATRPLKAAGGDWASF